MALVVFDGLNTDPLCNDDAPSPYLLLCSFPRPFSLNGEEEELYLKFSLLALDGLGPSSAELGELFHEFPSLL